MQFDGRVVVLVDCNGLPNAPGEYVLFLVEFLSIGRLVTRLFLHDVYNMLGAPPMDEVR